MDLIINWCFLCASEVDVNVEIKSLNDELKDQIGQFSLLNFNLQNMPSKICSSCHEFLLDYRSRLNIFASAEKMFLELLRTKSSRSIDIDKIKSQYNLKQEIQKPKPAVTIQQFEPVDYVIETVDTKSTSKRRFQCDFCSKSFLTKSQIETHLKSHIKNLHHCKICNKNFSKDLTLRNHTIKLHSGNIKMTEKSTKYRISAEEVKKPVSAQGKVKRFACEICNKLCSTKGALSEHLKTHSEVKNHVCNICQKAYKTASTLTQHMDTHGSTTYSCPECGLKLNTKRTLKQHMLKHTEIVKHICEFCDAKFKRTKTFKEHLISIHTEIKAYQCDWCDRKFSNGANCRKHKKEMHPEALKEADDRNEKSVVKLPNIEELIEIARERLKTLT